MLNSYYCVDSGSGLPVSPGILTNTIRTLIVTVILTIAPWISHAATLHYDSTGSYVTSISGLNVDGAVYDATFHLNMTFNQIWDSDGDRVFGDADGSLIDHGPMFWDDQPTSSDAAFEIMGLLGSTEQTSPNGDSFFFAINYSPFNPDQVFAIGDADYRLGSLVHDQMRTYYVDLNALPDSTSYLYGAWVSYEVAAVPLPAAFWLLGSALIGLGLILRERPSKGT